MQPITVAVGLTVTFLALTVLLCLPEFVYLAPHTRILTARYWPPLTAYGALAILTFLVALYTGARAAGLADLGRKVDLVERSIRRGAGGDPELAEQMQQQDRGGLSGLTRPAGAGSRMFLEPRPRPHAQRRQHMHRKPLIVALAALAAVLLLDASLLAQTTPVVPAAGVSPWLRAVNVLQQAFTGPLARGLSLISIVIGGLMFAFGEGGSKKALAGIIFGLGMAMGAANFLTWLFV